MKKAISLVIICVLIFSITACSKVPSGKDNVKPASTVSSQEEVPSDISESASQNVQTDLSEDETSEEPSETEASAAEVSEQDKEGSDVNSEEISEESTPEVLDEHTNILVVFFSRTGEQYNVGTINEGNTAVVAKLIAEKTGADMFEILPETDYYPYTYSELTDVAQKELRDKARPKIKDALPNMDDYDTVFIGAPVWWGDWPMIMYTFFENANLSGKNLVPFSTHEGSGLSGFDVKLASAVPQGNVQKGLAVKGTDCQYDKTSVDNRVADWLKELGLL